MGKWINIDDLPSGRVEWEDIFDAPSIDIVRCRECKYMDIYVDIDDGEYFCRIHTDDVRADDFCSYGERESE